MPNSRFVGLPEKLRLVLIDCATIQPVPRYSDWPLWLQVLVVAPHGLLLSAMLWLWWPKSDKDRKRFWLVFLYLLCFFAAMHFVFHF